MKIKKVEISGFRAFDDVNDSTFDFEREDKTTADFISIYAPNGFGKTSFYDAIEWCITGQIQRFYRNSVELKKLARENRNSTDKDKSYFLQHKGKTDFGYVNIITDEDTFSKKLTSKIYDFSNKGDKEKAYFKDVILSQEMVDNFLKEESADERYKKFIENIPLLKDYNNKLQNILKLIDENENEIKKLTADKKEIEDTQLNLDFEGDEKILDEINKAISNLIEKKQEIKLIQKETFTESEYTYLTNKINSEITSLTIEIETIKLRIGNIDIAYNGIPDNTDDNNNGIFNYFNNRNKIIDLEKVKNDINDIVTKIKNKENCELKDNKLKTQISEELELNKLYLLFKEKFKAYLTIENEINEKNKIFNNYESEKLKSEKIIKDFNDINQKNTTDLEKLQKELIIKQTRLKNIPFQNEKLASLTKNNELLTPQINVLNESISEKERLIEGLKLKLIQHHFFNDKIDNDIEILIDAGEFKDNKELITSILALENKIKIAKEEIITINDKINLQNELNNELNDFVSKGLEIVSKNNSSDCPLCNHTYKSFSELSEKITQNKLLGKIVNESLESKLKLENEINKSSEEISKNKSILKEYLKKVIEPFEKDKLKNENELITLTELKSEKIQELIKSENEIKEINLFFENTINTKEFEEKISKEVTAYEKEMDEINNVSNKNKTAINDQQNLIKSANENKEIILKSITELKSDKEYNEVIDFYSNTLKTNEINITFLEETIKKSNEYLDNLKNDIDENLKILNELNSKLLTNTLTKEEAIKKFEEVENAIALIRKIIQNFEQYIKTEFKIDLVSIDKNQVDIEFERIKDIEKEKQRKASSIYENYKIIGALKEDTYKFLKSEETKQSIQILKYSLKANRSLKTKLINEKDKLQLFIKESIDGFFYKDLINKIYQKIDPHPDYVKIEFNCDFKGDNSRLQIFTIDREGNRSIPTLYFSTAQINILSLSIFLARALKATDKEGNPIKCIFIDDPIQSMDSINILSFIDLFRSIIVNLDRQLIVSTHEENFHLLLQKKIPKDLFKSKFIEFETFGKLKKSDSA
ncbi:AAA family ATPase [Flavobacterium sp. LB3P21]|uniref:AAA family ATPase n=1 Tax=Flavobacterium sp. LB3P21 TaxID=3401719 RepID=UPI003AAAA421